MMTSYVLSPTQAKGQLREDKFAAGGQGTKHIQERAEYLSSLLGLPKHHLHAYPSTPEADYLLGLNHTSLSRGDSRNF